uniref:Uncharacterized protein n=1 Tax=Pan troglodytes TaxID=9598 RepID=A0A2I3SGI6_PANTR
VTVFFKTLRNHWKKITTGLCLLLYRKHCDNLLRRAAYQEDQVFGNQLISPNAQVKKATVFLNPAACKRYFYYDVIQAVLCWESSSWGNPGSGSCQLVAN